jgi:hypothetical protein
MQGSSRVQLANADGGQGRCHLLLMLMLLLILMVMMKVFLRRRQPAVLLQQTEGQ